MATVANTLKLNDRMTPALGGVVRAINSTLRAMEGMDGAASAAFRNAKRDAALATSAVEDFARSFDSVPPGAGKAERSITGLIQKALSLTAVAYGVKKAVDGIGGITRIADNVSNTTSKLGILNDMVSRQSGAGVSIPVSVDASQSIADLENKIFASARRARSAYMGTADAVAQLGINAADAFSGTDEIIAFSELMNKSFKVSGADAQAQAGAMRQLTQALASGVLRGDEFNSIAEQAPLVYDAIAKYMGKSKGEIRELAADGAVTAAIVKNAMFAAAGDIENRFAQIPVSFSDHMTGLQNNALRAFRPVLDQINAIAQNERFQGMVQNISDGFVRMAGFASQAINLISAGAAFMYDNWAWISPLIWGVVAALSAYGAYLITTKSIEVGSVAIKIAMAAASYAYAAATGATVAPTAAATAAQHGLNAALLASPITWIIGGIILLIAIIFAVVGAINTVQGTSISAIGVITGALAVAGAFIANLLMGLVQIAFGLIEYWCNGFADVANFIGNVFNDPVASVIHLFAGLADNVLGVLEKIASAMDFLFGSNFAGAVAGWRSSLAGMAENAAAKYGNGSYTKRVDKLDINSALEGLGLGMERFNYGNSWDSGYKFGEGIDNKLTGISDKLSGFDGVGSDYSQFGGAGGSGVGGGNIDRVGSVGRIEDDVTISEEDLKLLKDISSREFQLHYTQLTPSLVAHMNISEKVDKNEILEFVEDSVEDALSSSLVVKKK